VGKTIGFIGAGQFAGGFARLFKLHPDIDRVYATDVVPERAEIMNTKLGLDGTYSSFEEMLRSDCDAVAIFTQRWTHGPLVVQALRAGKHVYSAVPMATELSHIEEIVGLVEETGLIYMMGETSYYNPATIFAREKLARGEFGRVFYSEGDYVHDMDNGFYDAYRFSGGERWKETASYPPMLYPTHSIGGVLGALPTRAVSVSCLGVPDAAGDGVFDREVSMFDNDFSNCSALFELADGGILRTNEMRRVGYTSGKRESRFRFFGTEAVFEQNAVLSVWHTKAAIDDVSALLETEPVVRDTEEHADIPAALRDSFLSGSAPIQDRSRLPQEFTGAVNGHEGAHHFLVDDFVRSLVSGDHPPVDAWMAARFTAPGIVAHRSAQSGGARLEIPDFGDRPRSVRDDAVEGGAA
jgi:predicted dehydrogenase